MEAAAAHLLQAEPLPQQCLLDHPLQGLPLLLPQVQEALICNAHSTQANNMLALQYARLLIAWPQDNVAEALRCQQWQEKQHQG